MTENELIDRVANAIARQEDYFKIGGKIRPVSQRCHNPGNLTHWRDRAGRPYPTNNGFVQFPDEATGWAALRAQIRINVVKRGLTFLEFFAGKRGVYAGFCVTGDRSERAEYARAVASAVAGPGSDVHTPIASLLGGLHERAA